MDFKKIITACLMPIAFVACFDDSASADGKTSGEQVEPASSDDHTPASSAENQVENKDSDVPKDTLTLDSSKTLYQGIVVQYSPYGMVYVYNVDKSTFETDVRKQWPWFCDDVSGIAVVDSVSLGSPYARIVGNNFSKDYTIVDLRQTDTIVVNKKTTLESARQLYLMKSGMNFADAKKQAGKEVLESFGSLGELYANAESENIKNQDYKSYVEFIEDFMNFTTEDTIAAKLEKCGNITCDTEFLKTRYLKEGMSFLKVFGEILMDSRYGYDTGKSPSRNREQVRKDVFYLGNFMAHLLGAQACSAENEGDSLEVPNENVMMNCRSGEWGFSYKKFAYSTGSMTDPRNEKTYATVTYDLGGKTQTWMTEHLDYASLVDSSWCEEDSTRCAEYSLNDVLKLDSTVYISVDSCVRRILENCPECAEYGVSSLEESCEDPSDRFDVSRYETFVESVLTDKGVYQGACPDGWHIPMRSEFEELLDYMVKDYVPGTRKERFEGENRKFVSQFLENSYLGNPTGFGLQNSEWYFYLIDKKRAIDAVCVMDYCDSETRDINYLYVRCIKDE